MISDFIPVDRRITTWDQGEQMAVNKNFRKVWDKVFPQKIIYRKDTFTGTIL